jgi:glucose-1-phosphate cytidylyltransferase
VKVVIFCGGLGLRMGEMTVRTPKPMVRVGGRPILWHIMKYYAHFGHTDFVICLGHQAEVIKEYFLTYNEALANDFTLSDGGMSVELARRDLDNWRISFIDTGLQSTVGERLRRVRPQLEGEPYFLAHYGDTLTDAPLPTMIDDLERTDKVATFLSVRPKNYTFHTVEADASGRVLAIVDVQSSNLWINGGYFVLRSDVFDFMRRGEELVHEPFQRLIAKDLLLTHQYEGFWAPMDTLKDRQTLESLAEMGRPPWALWQREPDAEPGRAPAGAPDASPTASRE